MHEFRGPSNSLSSLLHEDAWLHCQHWKLNQSLQHKYLPAAEHSKQCQQQDKEEECENPM